MDLKAIGGGRRLPPGAQGRGGEGPQAVEKRKMDPQASCPRTAI